MQGSERMSYKEVVHLEATFCLSLVIEFGQASLEGPPFRTTKLTVTLWAAGTRAFRPSRIETPTVNHRA